MLEKYFEAKENSKKRRNEEYKEKIARLLNDVNEALNNNDDFILYRDTLHEYHAEVAFKIGFIIEWHSWGTYVYFNKRGIKKLEKKAKRLGL